MIYTYNSLQNKSISNIELYKYTKLEYVTSILNRGIYASLVEDLNDPFERKAFLNEDDMHKYKIVCLSTSQNQKLMWSHYANGHRGCSIRISPPLDYGTSDCVLRNVDYRNFDEYQALPNDPIERLYTKDKKWEYESEVRGIVNISEPLAAEWRVDRGKHYFRCKIQRIDFGCLADKDAHYLDALIAIRDYNAHHEKKIKVRKYKMSNNKYSIVLDKSFDYLTEIAKLSNGDAKEITSSNSRTTSKKILELV